MIVTGIALLAFTLIALAVNAGPQLFATKLDPKVILDLSELQGSFNRATSVYKVTIDRSNLLVHIDDILVTAEMGMAATMSLSGSPDQTLLLGDFPLKEEEVNGFLRTVIEEGLVVTALHNKFMMDSPRIMSMHFEGMGSQASMANTMGRLDKALGKLDLTLESPQLAPVNVMKSSLSQKRMEELLWKGQLTKGVYRISLGRGTKIGAQPLGESEGVDSWAAFAGSEDNALVNGDIATLENELPFVLKDLIAAKIRVLSIHIHMSQEKPRLVFVHYW